MSSVMVPDPGVDRAGFSCPGTRRGRVPASLALRRQSRQCACHHHHRQCCQRRVTRHVPLLVNVGPRRERAGWATGDRFARGGHRRRCKPECPTTQDQNANDPVASVASRLTGNVRVYVGRLLEPHPPRHFASRLSRLVALYSAAAMPTSCAAVVVGAGPAGLAAAACLKRTGIDPVILEAGAGVGTSWRRHYERLHLHTVKQHSALPGLPFAADVPTYPSRLDVVRYLDAYAGRSAITPRVNEVVRQDHLRRRRLHRRDLA